MSATIQETVHAQAPAAANARAVLQSVGSVVGGEAAVRAASFVAVLFIAREYGGNTLGAYALALAVATVILMFADNGLQTAAITQLSTASAAKNLIFGRLAFAKAILLGAATLLLAAIGLSTNRGSLFLAIGFWVTVRAVLQSFSQLQFAVLKSISKAEWIGIIQGLHSAILFSALWLCFREHSSIRVLLQFLTLCQFVELLLGAAVLARNRIWPEWTSDLRFLALLRMAAPFGLAYGLANLIIRADTIVLSTRASLSELGGFSAANTILLMVYVCSWLFGTILLPEMVRLANEPQALKSYAHQWARWTLLLALPSALVVALTAPKGIVALYGSSFAASGVLGSVMALACPLILLNSIYTTLVVAANHRVALLWVYGATAVATLVLDFLLGHAFGAMGIAIAIVAREAGMLLALWLWTSRFPWAAANCELQISSGGN